MIDLRDATPDSYTSFCPECEAQFQTNVSIAVPLLDAQDMEPHAKKSYLKHKWETVERFNKCHEVCGATSDLCLDEINTELSTELIYANPTKTFSEIRTEYTQRMKEIGDL